MTKDEKREFRETNKRWLAGGRIDGVAFGYNSAVEAVLPSGEVKAGAIVAAWFEGGHAMYTVEATDGSGDYDCREDWLRPPGGA